MVTRGNNCRRDISEGIVLAPLTQQIIVLARDTAENGDNTK